MPQYAQYNPATAAPSPVIGWYDTDEFTYAGLPASSGLLQVTSEQWAARLANTSGWAVSAGALVAYTPPAPTLTLAQQAQALLGGTLAVTSAGTPALNGSYAIDLVTQSHISAEMLCVAVTGAFADGTTTLAWLDASGAVHTFPSTAEFKAFALAVAAFVAGCFKVINGTSTTLPSASVTIA